ncbi:unnamed protein product, partial [Urochloa humidicola]
PRACPGARGAIKRGQDGGAQGIENPPLPFDFFFLPGLFVRPATPLPRSSPSRTVDPCMAAAASFKGRAIAGSFVSRVLAGKAAASPRRAVHASAYDKNVEDQVRPAFVPDDVIGAAANPDKYWAPNPKTGVFGPAAVDPNLAASAAGATDAAANGAGSVLDQKVWFRPLEDVEKPPPTG